jgi:uncharacterized protein
MESNELLGGELQLRWQEAMEDGVAPLVDLAATHEKALEFVSIDVLNRYAVSI